MAIAQEYIVSPVCNRREDNTPYTAGYLTLNTATGDIDTPATIEHLAAEPGTLWHYAAADSFIDHLAANLDIIRTDTRITRARVGKAQLRDLAPLWPEQSHRPTTAEEYETSITSQAAALDTLRNLFCTQDTGLPFTLPGAAFRDWRHRAGMKYKEILEQSGYAWHYEAMRPYYIGGRIEAAELGELPGPWIEYDISSAYPWAMSAFPIPWTCHRLQMFRLFDKDATATNIFCRYRAVADGSLPHRDEHGNVSYPADDKEREYFTTAYEMSHAELAGTRVHRIDEIYQYPNTLPATDFVDAWYRRRTDPDPVTADLAKFALVSVCGKFAANGEKRYRWRIGDYRRTEPADAWQYGGPIGRRHWYYMITNGSFVNVATAAAITSIVRARLRALWLSADRPIYCNTDSIICRRINGHIPPVTDLPGTVGIRHHYKKLWIAGKNLYTGQMENGNYRNVSAGIPCGDITADDIKKAALKKVKLK